MLTVWDSTQTLAIDNGARLEAEEMDDGNESDCAVGMQRG